MLYQTQDTVSVVICAYTEARWNALLAAVQSAIMQTHPAQEIILVIDHNPALFERVQPVFAGLDLTIIENKFGRGIAGARNSGILAASGTVVAFLDDDAVAYPDWVANMLESYRNPQVLGVGGAIEPLWETDRPNWFPTEFYWVVGCSYRGMPLEAQPVRNLIGANMSFRRAVFEQVGYFEDMWAKNRLVAKKPSSASGYANAGPKKSCSIILTFAYNTMFPASALAGTISAHAATTKGFLKLLCRARWAQKLAFPQSGITRLECYRAG